MGAWSTPSAGRRRGLEDSSRSRARCRASPPRPRGRDLDAPWSHRARRQRERSEVDLGVGGEAAADDLQRKRAGSDLRRRRRKEEDLENVARPHQHGGGIALRVRHYGPARLWVEGDSHRAGAGATAAVIVVATATTSGQCDGRQEDRAFRMVDVEEEHHTVVLVGHGQDAGDVAGHGDAGGTETDRYLANQRAERRSMPATAFSWASVTNATPRAWIATPPERR